MTESEKTKTTTTAATKVKDLGYTAVGLGVMGVQKLTVTSKSLLEKSPVDLPISQVKEQLKAVQDVAARSAIKVDDSVGRTAEMVEGAFAPLEAKLPTPAREAVTKVRDQAKDLHSQFRTKVLEPQVKA